MREQLTSKVQQALAKAYGLTDLSINWERPQEIAHGDMATPVALQVSKQVGKPPREVAEVILEAVQKLDGVEKAELAGPGYLNIWLTPDALLKELASTRQACVQATKRKEAPVIVEYSQPNIAKPLGVHHILSTVIGQVVANLYEHAGYSVVHWNYMGDWGTQFGKLAVAMERWGSGKPASEYTVDELLALYVKFHDEVEADPSLEEAGREAFKRLETGDKAVRAFREEVVAITKQSLQKIYDQLHVAFDTDISESFYEDKMEPIIEEGIKKGVFKEGEGGALIVEFPEETKLPPYLVRKSDGTTLYSTRDIAQMRYRIDEYKPSSILIVTDVAQKLHFEQLVETCRQLKWKLPKFINILFGRMRFADKKMSTRKGNILKLEDVLAEAVERAEKVIAEHGDTIQTDDPQGLSEMMGTGALVYGMLNQNRRMDLVFDWDKALSFEGNSAPYLQYTHARARSILRKANVEEDTELPKNIVSLTEKERILLNTLLQFSSVLEEARTEHMPHLLTNYLYRLSQDFNAFYSVEPILQAQEPRRALRLTLTALTAKVLKTGAELLTLRVPDRM